MKLHQLRYVLCILWVDCIHIILREGHAVLQGSVCVYPLECVENVPSQSSLKGRIRGGGLRPMLELGVTPSHISMLLEAEEEEEEVRRGEGEEEEEEARGGGGEGGGGGGGERRGGGEEGRRGEGRGGGGNNYLVRSPRL